MVLVVCLPANQPAQIVRVVVSSTVYTILLLLLLKNPSRLKVLAHIMLMMGVALILSSVFLYAKQINLVALQFLFMIVMGAFYMLGSRVGIVYSIIGTLPIAILLATGGDIGVSTNGTTFQQMPSPAFEILAVMNFITIIICQYMFFEAFMQNIREKEGLNKQLLESTNQAQQLAATKSNFLSTMSHELRTPLNSVIGITELLIEDKPEERQKENLHILQHSANDLLALINNVLDFSKIDSDKMVLEKVPFRLSEFMQNICTSLRVKANSKQLNFVLDTDPQLERVWISSDSTRLSQLIYNLVGNAIKFTEQGSITVKLQCLKTDDNQTEVLFSITDTGIGIHADKHEAIFESFTQAESHTTRKYGGTGLGLTIVKQILLLFGSKLQLDSSPGNGSKFSFTIQFATVQQVQKAEVAAAQQDYSHLRILIAEDNDVNRLLMKKQLEKLNVNAMLVENGQLAYEAVLNNEFDAILMDLHMPVLNGYEAVNKIRSLEDRAKANTYIIAFTASVTEQQEIFNSGFNDFLYKPVNMTELNNKLDNIAAHRELTH
jgi:signal transduction histidine kinase/CheY-like chemotaxis protein